MTEMKKENQFIGLTLYKYPIGNYRKSRGKIHKLVVDI